MKNKLFFCTILLILGHSSLSILCQEQQPKMTPQEMLFQGVEDQDQKKGYELVQQAIKDGVDINIRDNNGNTALILAAFNGNKEIIQLLLNAKANPDIQNAAGYTALILAAISKNKEIIQLLLNAKANPDIQNNNGCTALILAANSGNKEIIQLLLDANADIDIKNDENKTALDEAQENGHSEIVQMLQKEQIKRRNIAQKEVGEHLHKDLANIVSEYFVSYPKDSLDKKSER